MDEQEENPRGEADLAAVAKLIAEPPRAKALMALADGRWLPASMLALEAGVANSTMSGHLARLVDGSLLTVKQHGRHRYYRLADPRIAELVEVMARIAPRLTITSLRADTRAHAIRRARHCYDHLGGRLAVALTGAMARDGHLAWSEHEPMIGMGESPGQVLDPVAVTITPSGAEFLRQFDTDIVAGAATRCCVDWTEHRHHLAGVPGRAILTTCYERGWLTEMQQPRALRLTPRGRTALENLFDTDLEMADGRA